MRAFTQLIQRIDESNRTTDKLAALREYFLNVPSGDGAWAVYFLCGKKLKRSVRTGELRQRISEMSGHPLWLVEECYDHVGDLAETLSLLVPEGADVDGTARELTLSEMVTEYLLPLREADEEERKRILFEVWATTDHVGRLVWNKLITGGWRIGIARTLVTRALAEAFNIEQALMAHRLLDFQEPGEQEFEKLKAAEDQATDNPARPYPFYLASPIEVDPTELGSSEEWVAEWKWDGIRAQLIRRASVTLLWSRGEEFMTESFPELETAAIGIPEGTVLDGEILAWDEGSGKPMPFDQLQKRINRKSVSRKILEAVPVVFQAYDLLEIDRQDMRERPLIERRSRLEEIIGSDDSGDIIRMSPSITGCGWDELRKLRESSRERGVEGMMLKRRTSPYRVGRPRGDWFKWKIDPWTADMVLLYAQRGHGRRASLFTDYTFGVWQGDQLVTVAKAYSGLTNDEIRFLDEWIKANTVKRFGPVSEVPPVKVFEVAFEGIRLSGRHKSGVALRFPRISRIREDKQASQADSVESLKKLTG